MSIPDYATFLAKANAARRHQVYRVSVSTPGNLGRLWSLWKTGPADKTGVTPTASVVCVNPEIGSFGQIDSATVLRLARAQCLGTPKMLSGDPACYLLTDRLCHSGGLDGTLTSAQTTGLPSAALTRSTSGVGVSMGLEIFTTVGTTATTVVVSYTNSAGVAGRTSPAVIFGGTGHKDAARIITLPLQSGDIGVRSVESVTLAASTGTAGNFGVVLYRIIDCLPQTLELGRSVVDAVLHRGGYAAPIPSGTCLVFMMPTGNSLTGYNIYELDFIEE